jgi:hypothetical protein
MGFPRRNGQQFFSQGYRPMNEKQAARWESIRSKGRGRYIVVYGVLLWGLLTGFFWALAMSAVQGWDRFWLLLPIALIGFPIGGYFFGAMTWKKTEENYQKWIGTRNTD